MDVSFVVSQSATTSVFFVPLETTVWKNEKHHNQSGSFFNFNKQKINMQMDSHRIQNK